MQRNSTRECLCGCGSRLPSGGPRLLPGHRWAHRDAPPLVRFWRRVDYGGPGCWLWRGCKIRDGYGAFALISGQDTTAHRAVWTLLHGDPGPDLLVMHRCDTKACVRPSHLELGTEADNRRDYDGRIGRDTRACKYVRGARHHSAKLTADDVRAIRAAVYRPRTHDLTALAERYGITLKYVCAIRAGRSWRHLL